MNPIPNTIQIGSSDLRVAPLGAGAWQWGDRMTWGFGRGYTRSDAEAAFLASVNAGVTLIDTAEIYGNGTSERIVGDCVRISPRPVVVATKFAPLPTRIGRRTVMRALDGSLARLGVSCIDLYQVHWPFPIIPIEMLMDILADAVEMGKVRYIGVSNYSVEQMRRAQAALAKRGLALVSNQVEYSLLHRTPEVDGVWSACRELNVTLIAYSPLAKGLLTGKYKPGQPLPGTRRFMSGMGGHMLERLPPVIQLLTQIGEAHGGKTPAQVALNWLARQPGVLPIPGAKNAKQAESNAGALGWDMTDAESDQLSQVSLEWRV
ncbi:MAG: aldo/keto reductase [Chloroflexi bacterium]|nr:aldo/keto reductase [Chloroflexota bacterium]